MSRSRCFPLIVSLVALAVGSTPAWAQHRGGGGWPQLPHPGGRMGPSMAPPIPQVGFPGRGESHGNAPSMEDGLRPRPSANDCARSMALSPGDQILAVQPMEFGGRVQCRVKVMDADGTVRVMLVSPGF